MSDLSPEQLARIFETNPGDYEVHPVAALFPMLADDELAELAEDIKRHGQLHPIMQDAEGRIIDGRNRLAACALAGVPPWFDFYEGEDPGGYAWSVNVKRRSLTKAQIAVMAADRFADKDLSTREQAAEAGVSQPMMVWAHAARRYPDLHDAVLSRSKSLTDAYAVAQDRDAAEAERQAEADRLRTAAPDLLSLVDEERMSLADAVALLDAREEKVRLEEQERMSKAALEDAVRHQEHVESLERDRERLRAVVTGWPTMRNSILPAAPEAAEILAGLGEGDRAAIEQIISEVTEA